MDVWTIERVIDLRDVRRACMVTDRLYAVYGNARALRLLYDMRDGPEKAELTGATVIVYGRRADGLTAIAEGSVNGNRVNALLGEQFFAVQGETLCQVDLAVDGATATIARIALHIQPSAGNLIVDPGEEMPGLAEGLEALENFPDTALTQATVENEVEVRLTDAAANVYTITVANGGVYLLIANGEEITVEEVPANDTD
jgi:hypothetical protein